MRAKPILLLALSISLILLLPKGATAHGNGLNDTYPHVGEGCTTARYIDRDCDGYG